MSRQEKGFTLVELLVVVGIIGVLATFTTVAVGDAQKKARDAKRISDVKQISTIIEGEEAQDSSRSLTGCTTDMALANTCAGPGGIELLDVDTNFVDPSKSVTACTSASDKGCAYSITTTSGTVSATDIIKTNNYQICFYLESGAAGLVKGPKSIRAGGQLVGSCSP